MTKLNIKLLKSLEYCYLIGVKPDDRKWLFDWIHACRFTENNVYKLMRGTRVRWKIENETFNTLRNHGYNFEHEFGHGYHNLSTVFAHLMMLAFMVDQFTTTMLPSVSEGIKSLFKKAAFVGNNEALFLSLSD